MPLPHYTGGFNFNNKSYKRRKKIIKLLKFEILNKLIKEL
jgi:hypothetical protein